MNKHPQCKFTHSLDIQFCRLFPEYFYSFLQSYMQMISSIPLKSADDKIMCLHSDMDSIIHMLTNHNKDINSLDLTVDNDGLIIITTVATSCIRGLHHCNSKLLCLEILQQLAMYTTSETILDRILPYIVSVENLCFIGAIRISIQMTKH